MKFILIILYLQYSPLDFVAMQEFDSKETCEKAANYVHQNILDVSGHLGYAQVSIKCLGK